MKAVIARVPLMPTSQSASERDRAASASPCICSSVRKALKPSRIACGVIDWSHSRRIGLFNGFVPPAYWHNKPEDQLSLPSRVASVHEFRHIRAPGLANDSREPSLRSFDGLQGEIGRNYRKMREAPLAALHIKFLRGLDLDQVAHSAYDDEAIALEVRVVLLELAGFRRERLDDVLCHGGFSAITNVFDNASPTENSQGVHLTREEPRVANRLAPTFHRARLPRRQLKSPQHQSVFADS